MAESGVAEKEVTKRDDGLYVGDAEKLSPMDGGPSSDNDRLVEYVLLSVAREVVRENVLEETAINAVFSRVLGNLVKNAPSLFGRWAEAGRRTDALSGPQSRRLKQILTAMKALNYEAHFGPANYEVTLTSRGWSDRQKRKELHNKFGGVRVLRRMFCKEDFWGIFAPLLRMAREVENTDQNRVVFQRKNDEGHAVSGESPERCQLRLCGHGEELARFILARLKARGVIGEDAVVANEVSLLWNAAHVMPQQHRHSDYATRTEGFSIIFPIDVCIMLHVFPRKSAKRADSDLPSSILLLEIGDAALFEGDVIHAGQPGLCRVPVRRLHAYFSFQKVEPSQVLPRSDVGLATYLV